jgi:two-component system, LytTR family, sensor kinase
LAAKNPGKITSLNCMAQYLSEKLKYHVRIIITGAFLALVFASVSGEQPIAGIFLVCFLLLCAQFELFLWMATKLLKFKVMPSKTDLIKTSIYRLVVFYLVVLVISVFITFLGLSAFFYIKGENVRTHLQYFIDQELKEFLKFYVISLFLSTLLYFYFQWKAALDREQRLQQEKLLFQFETLKSQVNPHFLFNSLNTLSSLVSNNAELAEQFIQKLSAIYQYILEYREIEYIDLNLEVDFVKDYFYLQQIRDGNKIDLSIEISDPHKYKILPISLQLLVENALKHNLATTERPLKIVIYAENDSIVVKNNLQRKSVLENSKKIGLTNLRERIKYSIDREMKVIETRDEFKVIIPLIC